MRYDILPAIPLFAAHIFEISKLFDQETLPATIAQLSEQGRTALKEALMAFSETVRPLVAQKYIDLPNFAKRIAAKSEEYIKRIDELQIPSLLAKFTEMARQLEDPGAAHGNVQSSLDSMLAKSRVFIKSIAGSHKACYRLFKNR